MTPLATECIATHANFSFTIDGSLPAFVSAMDGVPPQDAIDKFDRSRRKKKQKPKTEDTPDPLKLSFGRLGQRTISAEFDGGHISSDGGLMLLNQVDEHYGISAKVAECFTDYRHASYVEYPIETLVKQRLRHHGFILRLLGC